MEGAFPQLDVRQVRWGAGRTAGEVGAWAAALHLHLHLYACRGAVANW